MASFPLFRTSFVFSCFALTLLLPGCVPQDISFNWPQGNEPLLMVEGVLTSVNDDNYVRLTWAKKPGETQVKPVDNALVIISDNVGNKDTLERENPKPPNPFDGYYFPRKLKSMAGRTYFLTIKIGDATYSASAFMPRVPAIEAVRTPFFQPDPVKSGRYGVQITFMDPQNERNFYQTLICDDGPPNSYIPPCRASYFSWNFSVFDDSLLPEKVEMLDITSPNPIVLRWKTPRAIHNQWNKVRLRSLTKEGYEYEKAIIQILTSDGGVFSPTPSNAPTNLKSDHPVTGFFHAMDVSEYKFYVQNP